MAFLTVEIGQNKENALRKVLEQEPGWNKSLVTRALLTYFLNLTSIEQENLVKTFGVEQKRLIDV
jgi:hypothetical protein